MTTQAPGIARAPDELRAKVQTYAAGTKGIRQSVETLQKMAREARNDPDLRGWAIDALRKAGIDGRDQPSVAKQAQAIVEAVRAQTIYVPDPVGTEWIQAPHVTLCLRNYCIPGEDCDGLFLAMLGAMLSIGLPAFIVRQQFGAGIQEHVLLGVKDGGEKWYADPSTRDPLYRGSRALREDWIDPMGGLGTIGASGAELVTLGRAARYTPTRVHQLNPQLGFGAITTLDPYAQSTADLSEKVQAQATSGDSSLSSSQYAAAITSYIAAGNAGATAVGPEIDLAGYPNLTQPWTQGAWQINAQLAALAGKTDQASAQTAQTYVYTMISQYQGAIAAGQTASRLGRPSTVGAPAMVGTAPVIVGVLATGAAAGVAWALLRPKKARR